MRDMTRRLQILLLRKRGLSYSDIGRILGVSKQNVHSIEKRTYKYLEECKKALQMINWALSEECLIANPGEDLRNVAKRIFELADKKKLKINATLNELIDYLKVMLKSNGLELKESVGFCIMRDGSVEIVEGEVLKELRQLNLLTEY